MHLLVHPDTHLHLIERIIVPIGGLLERGLLSQVQLLEGRVPRVGDGRCRALACMPRGGINQDGEMRLLLPTASSTCKSLPRYQEQHPPTRTLRMRRLVALRPRHLLCRLVSQVADPRPCRLLVSSHALPEGGLVVSQRHHQAVRGCVDVVAGALQERLVLLTEACTRRWMISMTAIINESVIIRTEVATALSTRAPGCPSQILFITMRHYTTTHQPSSAPHLCTQTQYHGPGTAMTTS